MPNSVTIDIGSYAIKAAQGKAGKAVKLERTVEVPNTLGLTIPTDDVSAEKMGGMIANMFTDHSLAHTDVRLSLPETLVSTKIISIPSLSDAELASAIQWQAEQHIPIPLEELSLEYQVIYRPEKIDKGEQMRVLLVGVRKSIVDKYLDVFLRAGLEPTILETQTLSLFRALQPQESDPVTMIVHIGATTTDIAIVAASELRFVYTHSTAGQVLTRTLEQGLQLDARQAEQYKRTYGLDATQLQGKIRDLLLPALRVFLLEMQKAMQFFGSQMPGQAVQRVMLSGGGAQLPGLGEFITEQLGVETQVIAPFATASGEIPQANQAAFAVAMGLLMREGA
jgi:type IV pilus assembly protein PilM